MSKLKKGDRVRFNQSSSLHGETGVVEIAYERTVLVLRDEPADGTAKWWDTSPHALDLIPRKVTADEMDLRIDPIEVGIAIHKHYEKSMVAGDLDLELARGD